MEVRANRILIRDYDYSLPHERIAEFPLELRDSSKLLVYEHGVIKDSTFYHLPQNVPAGSTLILNNTRVIEARVLFKKATGGVIEIFCLEAHGQTVEQ
jgi:S-adenosylmethionine:tRNA ribosyltransferase-isomerase